VVERVIQTRMAGADGTDRVELLLESRFERVDRGWRVSQKVASVQFKRENEVRVHPLGDVLPRFELVLETGADGRFLQVVNPEAPARALAEARLPAEAAASLAEYLAPAAVEARTRREWEASLGALYGQRMEEGTRFYGVEVLPGPAPERTFMLERTVRGTRDSEFGEVLVLALRCPYPAPLPLPAGWAAARERWHGAAPEAPVACDGEQWVRLQDGLPVRRELSLRPGGEAWTFTMQSQRQGSE